MFHIEIISREIDASSEVLGAGVAQLV